MVSAVRFRFTIRCDGVVEKVAYTRVARNNTGVSAIAAVFWA